MYICKLFELDNFKNKQCADFHFGVWPHVAVRKVTIKNVVATSKSKVATATCMHIYQPPLSFEENMLSSLNTAYSIVSSNDWSVRRLTKFGQGLEPPHPAIVPGHG